MALIFVSIAIAGSLRDPARRRDLDRRGSRRTRSGWASWRSRPAPSRSPSPRSSDVARRRASPAPSMFGGFILNGYQNAIPELAPFANLTWFGWTTNHIPLAGLVRLAVRRAGGAWSPSSSSGSASSVRAARPRRDEHHPDPEPAAGAGRPARARSSRATSENLPVSVAWGVGIGLFGLVIAGSGRIVRRTARQVARPVPPSGTRSSRAIDIATVGGFLELLFIEFGFILAGLAAATLVAGWASDETSGRLELLLATPLTRIRWVVAGARRGLRRYRGHRGHRRRRASRSARPSPAVTSPRPSSGRWPSACTRWRWPASGSPSAASSGRAPPDRSWRS